jgi:hypothetical protein
MSDPLPEFPQTDLYARAWSLLEQVQIVEGEYSPVDREAQTEDQLFRQGGSRKPGTE